MNLHSSPKMKTDDPCANFYYTPGGRMPAGILFYRETVPAYNRFMLRKVQYV